MRLPKPWAPALDRPELDRISGITFTDQQFSNIVRAIQRYVGRDEASWEVHYFNPRERGCDAEEFELGPTILREAVVRLGPNVLADLSAAAANTSKHAREVSQFLLEANSIQAVEPNCIEPFLSSIGSESIGHLLSDIQNLSDRLDELSKAALLHADIKTGPRPNQLFEAFVIAILSEYEAVTGKRTRIGWIEGNGEPPPKNGLRHPDAPKYIPGRPKSPLIDLIEALIDCLPEETRHPSITEIPYIVRRICNQKAPPSN